MWCSGVSATRHPAPDLRSCRCPNVPRILSCPMPQGIGDKIGAGATADVHIWAPGQVLKLYKPGFPRRLAVHEANMTRAVFLAGGPAPDVFDTVTVDGRFGIVLPRLDGPSLLELSRRGAMTQSQVGQVLAALARTLHQIAPPPEIYTLEQTLAGLASSNPALLPAYLAADVQAYLQRQPAGRALCHADLHPGNVIMNADGPRLIDWLGAITAAPAFDLAVSQVIMSELVPQVVSDPQRPRAVNTALQFHYAATAGMTASQWADALGFYLPVARVFALLTGSWTTLRPQLIAGIQASLQPPAANVPSKR
jgi:Phosphotransferase enzyme family